MADVAERLALLEQHVLRAIKLIESLREENLRLAQERGDLFARAEALAAEVASLRQRDEGRERLERDHRRLLDERRELLSQVEVILKELARIEGR